MNARSHTDIVLGIRKPLHEHWTGVLPHCLMLRCRKHSEGSFASSVSPNSKILGFGVLFQERLPIGLKETHTSVFVFLGDARETVSRHVSCRAPLRHIWAGTYGQRVCHQGLHLCSYSCFIIETQSLVFSLLPKEEAKLLPWDCKFVCLGLMSTRKPIRLPPRRARFSMQSLALRSRLLPLRPVSRHHSRRPHLSTSSSVGSPSFRRFSEVPKLRAPSHSPPFEN